MTQVPAVRTVLHGVASDGAGYAVGAVLQRGLPIVLLPLYAGSLTPSEYGQIGFMTAIAGMVSALLGLGLEGFVVRRAVHLSDDRAAMHTFVNTTGALVLSAAAVGGMLAAMLLRAPLGQFGIGGDVTLLAVAGAVTQGASTVFIGALLRAAGRVGAYLRVNIVFACVNASLTYLAVVGAHLGLGGWFLASATAGVLTLLVGMKLIGHRWSRSFSVSDVRLALAFGLPLLPHAISHWVLNLSDRVVLGAVSGAADTGVYNLAYQAAAPIGLLAIAVHQGAMPMYARAAVDASLRGRLAEVATWHIQITVFLAAAAALLAPPTVLAVFPSSYAPAASLIPMIALGYAFFALYLVPMDALSLMVGRTNWLWIATAAAAITNLALNVATIPTFGPAAAATNTAVAYGVLLVGISVLQLRGAGPRIKYERYRIAASAAASTIVAVGGLALLPSSGLEAFVTRGVAVVLLGAGLVAIRRQS